MFKNIFYILCLILPASLYAQIPVNTNFDVKANIPLDNRTVLDSLSDTTTIAHPNYGLQTFIKSISEFYVYDGYWKRSNEISGGVDTFYLENGVYKIVVGSDTLTANLQLNFGDRVYFSKSLGDNSTGQRGNPSLPFADPFAAAAAAWSNDIITGLTRDTFILDYNTQYGSYDPGFSNYVVYDGGLQIYATDSIFNFEFFPGSVLQFDVSTSSTSAAFAADIYQNFSISGVSLLAESSNSFFANSYVYAEGITETGEIINLDFDLNIWQDSSDNLNFYWQDANINFKCKKLDFHNDDGGFNSKSVSFNNFDTEENLNLSFIINEIPSTCEFVDFSFQRSSVGVNDIDLNVKSEGRIDVNFNNYINSTHIIDIDALYFESTQTNSDTNRLDIDLFGVGENLSFSSGFPQDYAFIVDGNISNSDINLNLNGNMSNVMYASINGDNNEISVTGDFTNNMESSVKSSLGPDASQFTFSNNSDGNTVQVDKFTSKSNIPFYSNSIVSQSSPTNLNWNILNSYFETSDSNFINHSVGDFWLIQSFVKYTGGGTPLSILKDTFNYNISAFYSNAPLLESKSEYDTHITWITEPSAIDKIKSQNVTLNGGNKNDFRITDADQIVFDSKNSQALNSDEGNITITAGAGNITLNGGPTGEIKLQGDSLDIVTGADAFGDGLTGVVVENDAGELRITNRLLPQFDTVNVTTANDTLDLDFAYDQTVVFDMNSAPATVNFVAQNPTKGSTMTFVFIGVGSTITFNFGHTDIQLGSKTGWTIDSAAAKVYVLRYNIDGGGDWIIVRDE